MTIGSINLTSQSSEKLQHESYIQTALRLLPVEVNDLAVITFNCSNEVNDHEINEHSISVSMLLFAKLFKLHRTFKLTSSQQQKTNEIFNNFRAIAVGNSAIRFVKKSILDEIFPGRDFLPVLLITDTQEVPADDGLIVPKFSPFLEAFVNWKEKQGIKIQDEADLQLLFDHIQEAYKFEKRNSSREAQDFRVAYVYSFLANAPIIFSQGIHLDNIKALYSLVKEISRQDEAIVGMSLLKFALDWKQRYEKEFLVTTEIDVEKIEKVSDLKAVVQNIEVADKLYKIMHYEKLCSRKKKLCQLFLEKYKIFSEAICKMTPKKRDKELDQFAELHLEIFNLPVEIIKNDLARLEDIFKKTHSKMQKKPRTADDLKKQTMRLPTWTVN